MPTETKTENRGGARPGAGKKGPNKIPGELKTVKINIRLYPTQLEYLNMLFGSPQAAIDSIEVPGAITV